MKHVMNRPDKEADSQPPSGGCVLKLSLPFRARQMSGPAAFRRLCVETDKVPEDKKPKDPAAFRRLCVETTRMVGIIWAL